MNTERRDAERLAARGNIRLEMGGISYLAVIRNLSQTGCMVEAAGLPESVGLRCEVPLMPGYKASGRIAWQLGEAIGISFMMPIPEGLVRDYALDDWTMRRVNRQQGR